jgi:hypothetical protein
MSVSVATSCMSGSHLHPDLGFGRRVEHVRDRPGHGDVHHGDLLGVADVRLHLLQPAVARTCSGSTKELIRPDGWNTITADKCDLSTHRPEYGLFL